MRHGFTCEICLFLIDSTTGARRCTSALASTPLPEAITLQGELDRPLPSARPVRQGDDPLDRHRRVLAPQKLVWAELLDELVREVWVGHHQVRDKRAPLHPIQGPHEPQKFLYTRHGLLCPTAQPMLTTARDFRADITPKTMCTRGYEKAFRAECAEGAEN